MTVGQRPGAGAVEEFDYIRFGGPTRVAESHVTVTTQVTIVKNNPDRVALILTNNGPDVLYWSFKGNPTFPNVQQLGSGQQEVFQVQNDGAMCSSAVFGVSSVTTSEVNVVELIRQRGL